MAPSSAAETSRDLIVRLSCRALGSSSRRSNRREAVELLGRNGGEGRGGLVDRRFPEIDYEMAERPPHAVGLLGGSRVRRGPDEPARTGLDGPGIPEELDAFAASLDDAARIRVWPRPELAAVVRVLELVD